MIVKEGVGSAFVGFKSTIVDVPGWRVSLLPVTVIVSVESPVWLFVVPQNAVALTHPSSPLGRNAFASMVPSTLTVGSRPVPSLVKVKTAECLRIVLDVVDVARRRHDEARQCGGRG